ncbi:BTB/POZ protein [Baffinella frigidus]|nr:BTB/POZ protein [Cryptophyta sp. CCMP2293]
MSAATVRFNVGGTVSEVAVSTIQSQPEALLAKMIDGRFQSGKDASGAYFIDRDPQLFRIVLGVYRDNRVYPLPLGIITPAQIQAELEYYGLQDFEGPIELSFMAKMQCLRGLSSDFSKWKMEQERIGQNLVAEGFARLLVARAEMTQETSSTTLTTVRVPLLKELGDLPRHWMNATHPMAGQIAKLFEQWNVKATVSHHNLASVAVSCKSSYKTSIKLEPAEAKAGA